MKSERVKMFGAWLSFLVIKVSPKFPAIKVHSWGGLGSQLFAYNACLTIKEMFPNRRLVFVHHTGGITRRPLELFLEGIETEVVDDFVNAEHTFSSIAKKKEMLLKNEVLRSLKELIKLLGDSLGFFSTMNTQEEKVKLKAWVLQVRGHYTQLTISRENLDAIRDAILKLSDHSLDNKNLADCLTVHVRLGDLVTLKQDALPNRLSLQSTIEAKRNSRRVLVFSDSSKDELGKYLEDISLWKSVSENKTANVIIGCSSSIFFVGTNSKITFWISAIRVNWGANEGTCVPRNIYDWLKSILDFPDSYSSKLTFY